MELLHLHASDFPTRHHSLSKPTTISSTAHHRLLSLFFPNRPTRVTGLRWSYPKACAVEVPGGGKMVIELVGAFNDLTDRMKVLSTSSSGLLFKSLKLSIPVLQSSPLTPDGRSPLSKALSIAMLLADLQMDAEVISAGILREVLEVGELSLHEIRSQIGSATAHLVHESLRVKNFASRVDVLDDHNAAALRKFCLTYYDIRALKLDMMKIYAPLAHAVGTNYISLELEYLSFQYLFPYAYLYVDTWLRSQESGGISLIDVYKDNLLQSLKGDPLLVELVDDISVKGLYKSRYSTMKKLLKDGRRPETCYRAQEIIQLMWKEIPSRTKDYIVRPKGNGYKSLHMASHSLYKAGVTDPEEAKRLKTIMLAAAEPAALHLKDFPSPNHKGIVFDEGDRVFCLLDKNGDGKLNIEELTEVIEELGAPGEDAHDMMLLLDSNSDGSLSSDELQMFQKQ